ncbi:MAG: AsmA-like C-terminal region-containing protein [Leptospiraceae bacterium]|nr:AsmA-like C-terminal region-containing protein [Leptospiraceae bacterium]MDW8305460.1 AsmA-like C-terminal region-containing protein [Leptospiraceae bacterium]
MKQLFSLPSWLKKLGIFALTLLLAILTLLVSIVAYLYVAYPPEKIKPIVLEKIQDKLKTKILFQDIHYSFGANLKIQGLEIYEPQSLGGKILLSTKELTIFFEPWPLLFEKKISLRKLSLRSGELFLRKKGPSYHIQELTIFKKTPSSTPSSQSNWQISENLPQIELSDFTIHHFPETITLAQFSLGGNETRTRIKLVTQDEKIKAEVSFPVGYNLENRKFFYNLMQNPAGEGKIFLKNFHFAHFSPYADSLHGKIYFKGKEGAWQLNLENLSFTTMKNLAIYVVKGEIFVKPKLMIWGKELELRLGERSRLWELAFAYQNGLNFLSSKGLVYLEELPFLREYPARGYWEGIFSQKDGLWQADGELQDFSLTPLGITIFEKEQIPIHLSHNRLHIRRQDATLLGHKVNLDIKAEKDGNLWQIHYHVGGKLLDLQKILQNLKVTKSFTENKTPTDIQTRNLSLLVVGKLSFDSVKYGLWSGEKLHADIEFQNQELVLKTLTFHFASASFYGRYSLKLPHYQHYFLLQFRNLKPNSILEKLDTQMRWYTSLEGQLEGTMEGKSTEELLSTLKGKLDLESKAGRLLKSDLQLALISGFLSVLEDRLSAIEYRKGELSLTASEGKIYIKRGIFDGYDITLQILGHTNFYEEGELHAQLRFQDSFIRDLANPLSLGIAEQKRGDWYVLPFSCVGKIDSPSCWQKDW